MSEIIVWWGVAVQTLGEDSARYLLLAGLAGLWILLDFLLKLLRLIFSVLVDYKAGAKHG